MAENAQNVGTVKIDGLENGLIGVQVLSDMPPEALATLINNLPTPQFDAVIGELAENPSTVEQMMHILTDEQRLEIVNGFCKHCSGLHLPCYCMRDD